MFSKVFFTLLFAFLPNFVRNSGYFEIQFPEKVVTNSSERISVCLRELLTTFSAHNECTFGQKSVFLSSNSLFIHSSSAHETFLSLNIPFTFRWTGSFSLIIEMQARGEAHTQPQRHLISDPDAAPAHPNWKYRTLRPTPPLTVRYRVLCDHNYHGNDCATFCRARDDTFGHYTCDERGRKVCAKGWRAENCDRPKCREGCNEMHGFCELPDQCTCKHGWKGTNCDLCLEYPGCLHGYCLSPFQCICHRNWGGILCDQDLNYCGSHDPCVNEGQCQNVAPDHYRCLCRSGFEGINCQTVVDSCATSPCLHSSVCVSLSNGSDFACVCQKGFEGKRCEKNVNECLHEPCLNGGTCHDLIDDFKCHCQNGWTGNRCEVDVDECATLRPCVHALHCLNIEGGFQCICQTGFEGKQCETEVNDCEKRQIECKNGGICLDLLDDFRCVCVHHFSGQFCQELEPSVCLHSNRSSEHLALSSPSAVDALLWRFNDTSTTARAKCPKVCLCENSSLKCAHECQQSQSQPISSQSCRQWRSSALLRAEVTSEREMKLIFATQVREEDYICNTLLTIHSLISNSRDFCCLEVPETPEVILHSRHAQQLRQYVSARVWPQLRQIVYKRAEEESGSTKWTIISVICVLLVLFFVFVTIVSIVLKRRNNSSNLEFQVVVFQNNLKDEQKRGKSRALSKNCEKLFFK